MLGLHDEDDDSDDYRVLALEDTSEDSRQVFEERVMEWLMETVKGGSRA